MKANELMVGDWVYAIDDNGEKHPCRVNDLKYDYINKCDDFCVDFYGTEYNPEWPDVTFNVEPIPLTPEILEKNGWKHEFDKKDYMVKYDLAVEGKNCWMMWAVKEHNLDIQRQDEKLNMYNLKVQRVCIPCDYVHELQHALRLCGIEKEILL